MTKRVLSMLLALIMALSLCVPAFAADEPEVSADEPATTAVDEPAPVAADEPAPAVADPEHLDERALQGAVDKAAEMEPGVIRGEYQYSTVAWPSEFPGTYPETIEGSCQFFFDKLAAARNVLASIKAQGGYATWMAIPGNSAIYEAALKGLQTAVNLLTKYVRSEQIDKLKGYETWYKEVIDENTAASYGIGTYDTQPWFEDAVKDALAFQQGMTGYADGAYTGALYKDFVTAEATNKKLDGAKGGWSSQAILAEYTDYIELRDAIADARAKLAGDDWFDGTAYPDLQGTDKTMTGQDDLTKSLAAFETYFSSTSDTGFVAGMTLKQVHYFLSTIKAALKENKHVLDIDAFYITSDYKTVQAVVKGDPDWKNDCRNYHLEISSVSTLKSPAFTARGIANGAGVFVLEANPTQLGINDSGKLKDGAVITVKLICDKGNEVVDSKTVTVDDDYNGPVIDKATYTPDSITVKLNKSLYYANGGTTSGSGYDQNQYEAATLTLSYNGKVVDTVTLDKDHGTDQFDAWTFNLKPVQLGDYTVELKVKEGKTSGHNEQWISRDTETVNVPSITTYVGVDGTDADWHLAGATGYPNLLKAIDACSDTNAMYAKNGMTDTLRKQLTDNLAPAQAIVAASATTPLSVANKAKVDAAIAALYGVLKNFEPAADPTALKTAIANGEALIASDYDSVTAWKKLQDAIAEGKDLEKQLPLSKTAANEGKIAAKAAAINAAIKDLTDNHTIHPATELAALKALIDGVPAQLNADDWTTESKNAVLAAVAEVQPLLTKTGVKKSEVSAAIDKLQAALSALSTEEPLVVPAAPAGGTGWVLNAKGQWFYYYKGVLQKGWMMSSKSKLWYWLDPETGVMATGFQSIEGKWYYFTESGDCIGSLTSGWQKIGTYINSKGQVADNWGWFYTKHDGHFGECTYTYEWGDL